MKHRNEEDRATNKQNGLQNADVSTLPAGRAAVNAQAEVIALLREAVELLTAIHDLQNEALGVLRSINSGI